MASWEMLLAPEPGRGLMNGLNRMYGMNRAMNLLVGMGLVLLLVGSMRAVASSDDCEGMQHLTDTGPFHICMVSGANRNFESAHLDRMQVNARSVGSSSSSTQVGRPAGTRYPVGPEQKKGLRERLEATYLDVLRDLAKVNVEKKKDAEVLVRGRLADLYFEVPTDPDSGVKNLFAVQARGELELELIDQQSGDAVLHAFSSMVTDPADNELDAQDQALEEVVVRWGEMLEASLRCLASAESAQSSP